MVAAREELERLVESNDLVGLLREVSLDEIARRFCARLDKRPALDEDDPEFWTWEVTQMPALHEANDLRRELIRLMVEHAADDHALAVIGAGPLEDSMSHAEDDLEWVELQAAASVDFRRALANVWLGPGWPERVMDRLDAAAQAQLWRGDARTPEPGH